MTILTGHLADLTSGRAPNAKLIIDGPPIKFPAGRTLYTGGRTIPFDHLGNIVATLVPTDTAGTDPETWQYQFTIVWDGGSLLPFSAEITGDTVDLIDLQPLNPADPVYIPTAVAIERVTGLAELLDDLGEATTGKATAAELTAETTARKAADATKANRPGVAAVAPLRAYGSSALIDTAATQLVGYFNRARRALGSASWVNNAVGGSMVADAVSFAFGSATMFRQGSADTWAAGAVGTGTWTPSALPGGTVIIDAIGNDLLRDGTTTAGGTTAKSRAGAANHLEALMRLIRAGSVRQETDTTSTGTWTTQTSANLSGGSGQYTTTPGAARTFTARNGDSIVLLGWDASAGLSGAAWSLTADGAPYKTGTTNNQTRKTPTGTGTSQIVIHVDGLPAGDHAMILTHTGTSGQFLYLDCILRESPTPPTIVLVKFAGVTSTGYAVFPGSGPALVPIYDAIVDAVAAKFPADGSVIVMDPKAAGFDPAQHTGADGTHAHDAGAQIIAAQLADVVNGLPARNGLVRL